MFLLGNVAKPSWACWTILYSPVSRSMLQSHGRVPLPCRVLPSQFWGLGEAWGDSAHRPKALVRVPGSVFGNTALSELGGTKQLAHNSVNTQERSRLRVSVWPLFQWLCSCLKALQVVLAQGPCSWTERRVLTGSSCLQLRPQRTVTHPVCSLLGGGADTASPPGTDPMGTEDGGWPPVPAAPGVLRWWGSSLVITGLSPS